MAAKAGHVGREALEVSVEAGNRAADDAARLDDDDGRRPRRTGTMWTASAHIITAVIGAGVLSLAWAMVQLGWAAGTAMMLLFAGISYYTSTMLAECYRCHRIHHRRLHQHEGDQEGGLLPRQRAKERVPQLQQPLHDPLRRRRGRLLADTGLRPDMVALHRRRGYVLHLRHHRPRTRDRLDRRQRRVQGQPHRRRCRRRGHADAEGLAQPAGIRRHLLRLLLRLHPHRDTGHDQGAAAIGGDGDEEGDDGERGDDDGVLHAVRVHGLRGVRRRGAGQPPHGLRLLRAFLAAGRRQRRRRRAPRRRVPGLLPAPLRVRGEAGGGQVARHSGFMAREVRLGPVVLGVFRLTWRTAFVCLTTVVAMMLPFFGDVVGLLGAVSFWPLSVYFPVEMYIAERGVRRWSTGWVCLQTLSAACLLVSVAGAVGSTAGVIDAIKLHRPFSG